MWRQYWLELWYRNKEWIQQDILIPFSVTRLCLLLVGWFSRYFPLNVSYPFDFDVTRAWHFSPYRLLDIWGRWDTKWYLEIAEHGYSIQGDVQTSQNNLAFFPLYPYLIKFFVLLVPPDMRTADVYLLIGVILANLSFLGALVIFHKLISLSFQDDKLARNAVLYLIVFPTSFFFSCAYPESTFLFLSLAVFYLALRQKWTIASIAGCLLALTRPYGVMIIIPLLIIYMESVNWKVWHIRWNILWTLLIPAGLLFFLGTVYKLTGRLLAPLEAQAAWERSLTPPWETFFNSKHFFNQITQVEQALTLFAIILIAASFFKLPVVSYGVYSLFITVPSLMSGTLLGIGRHFAIVFPIFIVLGMIGKKSFFHHAISFTAFTVQILLMVAWSQMYTVI